jgi:hypothetical protein
VFVAGEGDEQLLLLVCADGAGSATASQVGSRLTCDTIATELSRFHTQGGRIAQVTRETVCEWIASARAAIATQAAALSVRDRELACTLVGAVLGPESSVFFQIGDGAIVAEGAGGACGVVFWPDAGEYANTTFFITGVDAIDRLQFRYEESRPGAVALLTDGLQSLALQYATQTVHRPFFAPMFESLRTASDWESLQGDLAAFLDAPAVNARTDDDKTLIVAVCHATP